MKKQTPQLNQYELVLAMTEYIRRNPDSKITHELKQCKQQMDQMEIFQKKVLGEK